MPGTSGRVVAVVSTRSVGGKSIFDPGPAVTATTVGRFTAALDHTRAVADVLVALGFELSSFHPLAISFSGTAARFEEVFGVRFRQESLATGRGWRTDVLSPEPDDVPRLLELPSVFGGKADGVAIARPPRLVDDAGSALRGAAAGDRRAPCLPDELAVAIWGEGLEAMGATGYGVVAALIGTGHYRHPFFAEHGYRVLPTLLGPGRSAPLSDDHGHGTGEAAHLFAAAPDLCLRPVKGLCDPAGDILTACDSAPRPQLIVISWGYDVDQRSWADLAEHDLNLHNYLRILEAAIAYASARGILVCVAVPRTWQSFPASHPDVVAIAAAPRGSVASSLCAGSAVSRLYPRRQIPDFWSDALGSRQLKGDPDWTCGCVQPAQPGSILGQTGGGGASAEGWAWCDAASVAFPLAASLLALFLEQHRGRSPAAVKALLRQATQDLSPSAIPDPGGSGPSAPVIIGGGRVPGPVLTGDRVAALARAFEAPLAKAGLGS